ncbi:hypothetical protein AAFF_G00382570 [Aldrovandia affinis]|uniref:Doublecortin domain-containing protein n=1 Tax=Aldrovandia affinis TaxID=143900 RepID=A0AAD7X0Y0_9TELE|nr:hypothetical protein AAFF_G00382570 [Aldrovandia affinis]
MEGERRPVNTSTLCSGTSEPSRGNSRSHSSLRSSLEEALVQEYSDRFSTTSLSPSDPHLFRKYTSPYVSKGSKDRGSKRHSADQTPDHGPLSSALMSSGHGRRPHSVSIPQPRRSLPSSQLPPVFKRQPAVIRVIAHKNWISSKIAASNFTMLLEACTSRLKLISAARRIFLEDGREVFRAEHIPNDAYVCVSCGEPFVDPQKEIRVVAGTRSGAGGRWGLSAETGAASPSVIKQGGKLDTGRRGTPHPPWAELNPDRPLLLPPGPQSAQTYPPSPGIQERGWEQELRSSHGCKLDEAVTPLDRCLQSSVSPLQGLVWVSRVEGFSPARAKLYLEGVVRALRGRLRPAGERLGQVSDRAPYANMCGGGDRSRQRRHAPSAD